MRALVAAGSALGSSARAAANRAAAVGSAAPGRVHSPAASTVRSASPECTHRSRPASWPWPRARPARPPSGPWGRRDLHQMHRMLGVAVIDERRNLEAMRRGPDDVARREIRAAAASQSWWPDRSRRDCANRCASRRGCRIPGQPRTIWPGAIALTSLTRRALTLSVATASPDSANAAGEASSKPNSQDFERAHSLMLPN